MGWTSSPPTGAIPLVSQLGQAQPVENLRDDRPVTCGSIPGCAVWLRQFLVPARCGKARADRYDPAKSVVFPANIPTQHQRRESQHHPHLRIRIPPGWQSKSALLRHRLQTAMKIPTPVAPSTPYHCARRDPTVDLRPKANTRQVKCEPIGLAGDAPETRPLENDLWRVQPKPPQPL